MLIVICKADEQYALKKIVPEITKRPCRMYIDHGTFRQKAKLNFSAANDFHKTLGWWVWISPAWRMCQKKIFHSDIDIDVRVEDLILAQNWILRKESVINNMRSMQGIWYIGDGRCSKSCSDITLWRCGCHDIRSRFLFCGTLWGALRPGTSWSPNTLHVVYWNSTSDLPYVAQGGFTGWFYLPRY